jgi:hypothetical protein
MVARRCGGPAAVDGLSEGTPRTIDAKAAAVPVRKKMRGTAAVFFPISTVTTL